MPIDDTEVADTTLQATTEFGDITWSLPASQRSGLRYQVLKQLVQAYTTQKTNFVKAINSNGQNLQHLYWVD